MQIKLGESHGYYLLQKVDTGETVLVQLDWDYPGLASNFGFVPCECGETDGTVDCPHKTASAMIQQAQNFLDDHIGATIDDPGYFS